MRQHLSLLLIALFSVLSSGSAYAQDCTNPNDILGAVVFNYTHGVFQGCTPAGWQIFHSPVCPDGNECASDPCSESPTPGTTCADGTIYAGDSPHGDVPMFTTPADAAARFTWNDGSTNYQNTSMTNCTDATPGSAASCRTGADNTTFLMNASGEPDHPFAAAAYCANLAPPSAEAFGHADWYLPAQDELNVLFANKNAGALIGSFDETGDYPESYYWSSSESSSVYARGQEFENGAQFNGNKPGDLNIRCVRR